MQPHMSYHLCRLLAPRDQVREDYDEGYTIDFVSERPIHSESTSNQVEEIPAHEHTVRKLYEQLQRGLYGYAKYEHELQQHMDHSSNETFNDMQFPLVMGLSDMIIAERLAREQALTLSQWETMFCGIPRQGRLTRPMNVHLYANQTGAVEPEIEFDICSFLGFATNLAMLRRGLLLQIAPRMQQRMSTDVPPETSIFRPSDDSEQPVQPSLEMLRDVPLLLLGRIEGTHNVTVHVSFPHMRLEREEWESQSKAQLIRWTNEILLPAIYACFPAHYTQYLPGSYRHAVGYPEAEQIKRLKIDNTHHKTQLLSGYHLQPAELGAVWSRALDIIKSTPSLWSFREPQLFFSAEGTRLQFSRRTLDETIEAFQSYFESIAHMEYVDLDRFYVEVARTYFYM